MSGREATDYFDHTPHTGRAALAQRLDCYFGLLETRMQILKSAVNFGNKNAKEARQSPRRKSSTQAWVRLDGFAMRPCQVVDMSDKGVRIQMDGNELVPATFTLLMSRSASAGRAARVKWRRGSVVGAAFS